MRNKFIFCAIVVLLSLSGFAQQLPLNTCGIVHIYDASGNRIKRVYFCNNGNPYPARMQSLPSKSSEFQKLDSLYSVFNSKNVEFQAIDALYPNPSTGKFFITFSKPLYNATVSVIDVNGRTVSEFQASGNKIDFNLSSLSGGIYFIKINDSGNIISKKVVKQ